MSKFKSLLHATLLIQILSAVLVSAQAADGTKNFGFSKAASPLSAGSTTASTKNFGF